MQIGSLEHSDRHVAVLIPCYNESLTVAKVVRDFKAALPSATVYVFDNNSTDTTVAEAVGAGAVVFHEKRQGKGYVVGTMLEVVDADYYVMVDGDDTYPAASVMELLTPVLRDEADMVVGQRLTYAEDSFRPFHVWGNRLVCSIVNLIFGSRLTDIMSGYRAFNRAVAERLPVVASGFDVETEMTLQLLFHHFEVREAPIAYGTRRPGSYSKLRTVPDGLRVLVHIITIVKAYKPLTFFGTLALLTLAVGLAVGAFPVIEFARFQYVSSVPKAILAASCVILGFLLGSVGMLLHTINFRVLEMTQVFTRQLQRSAVQPRGPGRRSAASSASAQ